MIFFFNLKINYDKFKKKNDYLKIIIVHTKISMKIHKTQHKCKMIIIIMEKNYVKTENLNKYNLKY